MPKLERLDFALVDMLYMNSTIKFNSANVLARQNAYDEREKVLEVSGFYLAKAAAFTQIYLFFAD